MSKSKSATKESHPAPPPGLKPAAGVVAPLTCLSCQYWFRSTGDSPERESAGQCRTLPPDQPTNDLRPAGRVMSYKLTLSSLPACGAYQARSLS